MTTIRLNLPTGDRQELLASLLSIHEHAMAVFDQVEADRLDAFTSNRIVTMNEQARGVMRSLAQAVRNTVPAERLAEFDAAVESRGARRG